MIKTWGEILLALALCFSFLQSVIPFYGYWRRNPYLQACARPAALGQFVFITLAYGLLTFAFVTNDFSIAYVAANSHPSLPLLYRATALWGSHEGSLLLWIFILAIWTILFSFTNNQTSQRSLVIAILGFISFCFLSFLSLTSNPFLATTISQTGHDLNPLLQDPGFIFHPPMLYVGYVGFSVSFAITQAALIKGQLDYPWAESTRRFTLLAWCFLTFGIALGSWWAYCVLGWGGFWFWDPVENASLLPWITGTALIHVLILVAKRDIAKNWAVLLTIICFALSLLGTFLVRSGVLVSVHTFAQDPRRGIFLLLLLAALLTIALIIYVCRLPKDSPIRFTGLSREMSLLLNSILLIIAMTTILLGTLYPLIIDALQLGTLSVGAPYFNAVMTPLVFIIMIFMALGPLTCWQHQSAKQLWHQASKKMVWSILFAIAVIWSVTHQLNITAIISLSLSFWIIATSLKFLRTLPAMSFAHCGFAILIIGIMLSTLLNEEIEVRMRTGQAVKLGPYQFFLIHTQAVQGSNYRGIRATFDVIKNTRHITYLFPEKRIYPVRDMVITKVDIHPSIFRDLYIALGEPLNQNEWSVRIYYKPFIRWIWFGGLLMIIGGLFAIKRGRST